MADILHMVPIGAEPEEVYRALTEQQGLSSWWTTEVEAEPEIGSTAKFSFDGGQMIMQMKIAELAEPNRVVWQVAEPSPPEWKGTQVTWDLQASDEGTHLLFGHRGWATTEGSFPAINYNWAYYLTSLKEYMEKGQAFPNGS